MSFALTVKPPALYTAFLAPFPFTTYVCMRWMSTETALHVQINKRCLKKKKEKKSLTSSNNEPKPSI